jgi:hypothetical protein
MTVIVGVFLCASCVIPVWGQQSITLPRGTIAEKIGAGHFRFKLPDGQVVEVNGLQRGSGGTSIVGDCGVYDRAGKLVTSGKAASLKSSPKPEGAEIGKKQMKIASREYVKIDDEVTWLPATITFKPSALSDREPPGGKKLAKPLSPQPDPPGEK